MTGPVRAGGHNVWWVVITPGHRVLLKASRDADHQTVIDRALVELGHTPVIEALGEDGDWFIPAALIPVGAMTRVRWPAHLTDNVSARHATQADIDLHHQTAEATR